ncbi:MAG: alpha/beta hydrolase [Gammaproteobacteria bacterium]|nr:alpha/beta hydrolase [Gammaproteobacteria bacterium]NVK88432.1 alpha/beta hydrolase [Gammaproteobacteria bacterium]
MSDSEAFRARIVLIRGLGRDQLHWSPLIASLRAMDNRLLIETPDLPGAGRLYQQSPPLNLSDYGAILQRQISASTLPTLVVGLSLGGMVALQWASEQPERFQHVVAINSSSGLSPFYWRLKVYKAWRYPGAIFRFNYRSKESAIYHMTCNARPMPNGLLEQWVAIQHQHPVNFASQIRQVIAAWRFQPPLKTRLPRLTFINSNADRLVDPRCSMALADYYEAPLKTHDWAGHDLPQDDPQWVAKILFELSQTLK